MNNNTDAGMADLRMWINSGKDRPGSAADASNPPNNLANEVQPQQQ